MSAHAVFRLKKMKNWSKYDEKEKKLAKFDESGNTIWYKIWYKIESE